MKIVVGVDGSPGSYAAMRWAVAQAHATGASIEAVYVLEPVVPLDFTGAGFGAVTRLDPHVLRESALEAMDRVIAATAGDMLGDIRRTVIEHANPGQTLVRTAAGATALVVGAHRHHGLGFLLGSTATSCVRQALSPVVVVPAEQPVTAATPQPRARAEEVLT